jgi:hypothetical protein
MLYNNIFIMYHLRALYTGISPAPLICTAYERQYTHLGSPPPPPPLPHTAELISPLNKYKEGIIMAAA